MYTQDDIKWILSNDNICMVRFSDGRVFWSDQKDGSGYFW